MSDPPTQSPATRPEDGSDSHAEFIEQTQTDVASSTAQEPSSSREANTTTPQALTTSPPSSEATSSSTPQPQTCTACVVPITPTNAKPCPRCHTTPYCSRVCQKNDYKKHKKGCAELAQKYAMSADVKMAVTRVPPKNDGRRGGLQKWQFDT